MADTDTRIARRKDGALKHAPACTMAFGRLDVAGCARCEELSHGAETRADPAGAARGRRARYDAQHAAWLRTHVCPPFCTAHEW